MYLLWKIIQSYIFVCSKSIWISRIINSFEEEFKSQMFQSMELHG